MEILDLFPIWAVYIGTVIVLLIAVEIGFRIGIWLQDRNGDEEAGESRMTGVVVGGMLGLMAFLMAFTIGIVIDQHGGRKAMVVTEANAIGTAWLRSGFLPEPDRATMDALLQEYTEIRLAAAADPAQLPTVITRSQEIHGELWSIMEMSVRQGNESDIMALVVESVNDVIDIHSLRITAFSLRLPRVLGIALFAATILSFLLVGVASSSDRKRDPAIVLLFVFAFVAVLIIIVDLDRPQQGLLTVSQSSMEGLLQQMQSVGQ